MKRRLSWQPYARRFHSPVRIKGRTLDHRRGLWLTLSEGERSYGAECAPLPGWHPESLAETEQALLHLQAWFEAATRYWERWSWQAPYFGILEAQAQPLASVQTSLEMLLLREAGFYRPELFHLPASEVPPSSSVLIPDLLHVDLDQLRELWAKGIRVFKVKIGRAAFAEEQRCLLSLWEIFGSELRLRLDANQALSGPDATIWLSFLTAWPIDYLEDPGFVASPAAFALAIDESLQGREPGPVDADVLVLKPNCLGLSRTIGWLQTGQRAVLSNTYESRLSLQVYLWIYSRFVARPEALGLGTVTALPSDFSPSLVDEWGIVRHWPSQPFFAISAWPGV
jgi:o-succinylbenzoate synthase